jgi:hypothetical protein
MQAGATQVGGRVVGQKCICSAGFHRPMNEQQRLDMISAASEMIQTKRLA